LLALLCLALYYIKAPLPFWHNERNFGPFPNRNQTGNLFGLAAVIVLACGQDDIRHSRQRWILWLLGFAILVGAVVINFSRAGILLLLAGSALWLGVPVLRKGSASRMALGFRCCSFAHRPASVWRQQSTASICAAPGPACSDFRMPIFHDAQLIRASLVRHRSRKFR
jgi:hypothetical protein